jgi:hypothetical protein
MEASKLKKQLKKEGIDNDALVDFKLRTSSALNISRQAQTIAPIFEHNGYRVYQYAERAIARFHFAVPFPGPIVNPAVMCGSILAINSIICRILFLRPDLAAEIDEIDESISQGVQPWMDTFHREYLPSEMVSFVDQYEFPMARSGRRGNLNSTKINGVKIFTPSYLFLVEDENEFDQDIPVCTGSFDLPLAANNPEAAQSNIELFKALTSALPVENRRALQVWTTDRFQSLCGTETRDMIARQLEGNYPHVFCQKTPNLLPPAQGDDDNDFEVSIRYPKEREAVSLPF